MNTPQQQAELYRKAAETIEMCAEHGIEPMVIRNGHKALLKDCTFLLNFKIYEFPLAVIEGQLVWADTVVYNGFYCSFKAGDVLLANLDIASFTLTPPKQPLCEVEGKPVYKGDTLYMPHGVAFEVYTVIPNRLFGGELAFFDEHGNCRDLVNECSWNPPKHTVMVDASRGCGAHSQVCLLWKGN